MRSSALVESATISPEAKSCCTRTRELCGCAATPRARIHDQALSQRDTP